MIVFLRISSYFILFPGIPYDPGNPNRGTGCQDLQKKLSGMVYDGVLPLKCHLKCNGL